MRPTCRSGCRPGVGGALKRAGGDEIEFAAVRQAPVPLGDAIVTPAGSLAARAVIHAVSLDRDRRTSGPVIEAAVRRDGPGPRARRHELAFPALGTGVGGFPLDEAARITVADGPRGAAVVALRSTT